MSTRRISKSAGWVSTKKLPKGPNGRCLCRKCGNEVPTNRRTFCSAECVHEHKIRTNPGYARRQVFLRDRGVCLACGLDTVAEEQRIARAMSEIHKAHRENKITLEQMASAIAASKQEFKQTLGTDYGHRSTAGYWDADHTVPVIEGGGECELDNYRTLCIPCHRIATAALRRRISKRGTHAKPKRR